MVKFFKRTLYVILGLIALGATSLFVRSNSESLSTDIAYLKCALSDHNNASWTDEYRELIEVLKTEKQFGRLRKDWIKDSVLLNWVAREGKSESGLEPSKRLSVNTNNYSGYSYTDRAQRTFDRDTLLYTWERKESSVDKADFWRIHNCVIIEKRVFEVERKKSAAATKAKQKI
jgi:hypothetical protein